MKLLVTHLAVLAFMWTVKALTNIPHLDTSIKPEVDAILLRDGRPDMQVLSTLLETREQSDTINENLPLQDDIADETMDDTDSHRSKRYVLDWKKKRWTRGFIPYRFDSQLATKNRESIQNVISVIEYWTFFRFIPWNSSVPSLYNLPHKNYLLFIPSATCWSYVGNVQKNGQKISCCTGMSCLHELGHAIGFHHEHSNPLRDQYIRINYENVLPNMVRVFHKRKSPADRGFGYFDLSSVMAYPSAAYSKNKREVITVYDREMEYLIQKKDQTAFYMFYEAQKLYNMKAQKCPNYDVFCTNDGYMSFIDGKCRCRCPKGLDSSKMCKTVITSFNSGNSTVACGQVIYLSEDNPVVTIVTPGYPLYLSGEHKCTWYLKGPVNSTLSIDFNDFEVTSNTNGKCDSHVEIGHQLPGQPGVRYCGRGFKKTILSEVNVIRVNLEVKSSVRLNATVKLQKQLCYTNGGTDNSYSGTVNVTEDFRTCLPWDQVTHCRMNTFSVKHMDLVHNYCRNPGYGTRPWCYVDADTCDRGYCDVCHYRRCYDLFDDCQSLLQADPVFCTSGLDATRGCRLTCGLCEAVQTLKLAVSGRCGPPPSLTDGVVVADTNKSYAVGDVVIYECRTNRNITAKTMCTTDGTWTNVVNICQNNTICADNRPDCLDLLERNPTMCLGRRAFVRQKCSKTCGICNWRTKKTCRDHSTQYNTLTVTRRYVPQGGLILRMCKFGYWLSTGNLQRACKPDGSLTGVTPRCLYPDKITSDSYHVTLRRRTRTGSKNQAIIINNSFYKINRAGEITGWKFYSNYNGGVTFQVWTYESKSKGYRLRGQNIVNNTKSDRLVQVNVPSSDRIKVLSGYLLGVHYHSANPGGIPYDECLTQYDPQGANIVELNLNGETVLIDNYYRPKKSYKCRLYSFSAIIGPNTTKKSNNNNTWRSIYDFMRNYFQSVRRRLSTLG